MKEPATLKDETTAPVRTCIGCRLRCESTGLVRCALTAEGASISRTLPGRGAWLCSIECFALARRKRAFDRAFRTTVPPETLDSLLISLSKALADMEHSTTADVMNRPSTPLKG